MKDEILTAREVATYLKVPLSSLHWLARTRRIPGFKVGRHWRFKKSKIEKWMDKQEKER